MLSLVDRKFEINSESAFILFLLASKYKIISERQAPQRPVPSTKNRPFPSVNWLFLFARLFGINDKTSNVV